MSDRYHLLRLLIREEMEFYGKNMGQGYKSMGSSTSGEVEIDARVAELQTVEGQIQQLEVTPLRLTGSGDTKKLDILKSRQAELELEIKSLQGVL
jgi:hypothetical protein